MGNSGQKCARNYSPSAIIYILESLLSPRPTGKTLHRLHSLQVQSHQKPPCRSSYPTQTDQIRYDFTWDWNSIFYSWVLSGERPYHARHA